MLNSENCSLFGTCGGCGWGGRTLVDQREAKLSEVRPHFANARFAFTPGGRVRDRADLIWQEVAGELRLGLYGVGSREVVDLDSCMMMTPALEAFMREFRALKPPGVRLGSVRLRISPSGARGVWLDFANADVKTLFDEREYLRALSGMAFVEIGQRRKALVWRDGAPKLVDPDLRAWFETYDGEGGAIPLFGPVGGFSQTGFAANRALVQVVGTAALASGARNWVELFCGNGNFTLALAARGLEVEAVEVDELALRGLEMSFAAAPKLRGRVRPQRADVYLQTGKLPDLSGRGLLVDPPRAGMRQLLEKLKSTPTPELPSAIVYVSCFTEIFLAELAALKELGYHVDSLEGVDQFPHSPHTEWITRLSR